MTNFWCRDCRSLVLAIAMDDDCPICGNFKIDIEMICEYCSAAIGKCARCGKKLKYRYSEYRHGIITSSYLEAINLKEAQNEIEKKRENRLSLIELFLEDTLIFTKNSIEDWESHISQD